MNIYVYIDREIYIKLLNFDQFLNIFQYHYDRSFDIIKLVVNVVNKKILPKTIQGIRHNVPNTIIKFMCINF